MAADLTGKVAVITGPNRGIGFALCRMLASQGMTVVLGSRDTDKGAKAAGALRADGLDVTACQLEVTDQASVDAFAAWIESQHGRLDVLVNNAGIMPNKLGVLEVSLDEVELLWQVNTLGAWRVAQALVPTMMRGGWGRIVNVSSYAGSLEHMTGVAAAYRVSKAALNAITKTLAHDLQSHGILVNSVCPNWVATDMGGAEATGSVEDGAASVLWALTLDDDGPTGGFFQDGKSLPW